MHVTGGILQYSITCPEEIVRRRNHSKKVMGVGND